jgi:GTP cyclohydrolase I
LGDDHPPLGIALLMEAEHLCKSMRGVKKQGKMTASMFTGLFKDSTATRQEFMQIVGSGQKIG